jgi:hypothetical protein
VGTYGIGRFQKTLPEKTMLLVANAPFFLPNFHIGDQGRDKKEGHGE